MLDMHMDRMLRGGKDLAAGEDTLREGGFR